MKCIIRFVTVTICLLLLTVARMCGADPGRSEHDLSGTGWRLWLDSDADWKRGTLCLPPVDIDTVPVRSPESPMSQIKLLRKQTMPAGVMADKRQSHSAAKGYARNTLFIGRENRWKALNLRAVHKYSGYSTLGAAFVTGPGVAGAGLMSASVVRVKW